MSRKWLAEERRKEDCVTSKHIKKSWIICVRIELVLYSEPGLVPLIYIKQICQSTAWSIFSLKYKRKPAELWALQQPPQHGGAIMMLIKCLHLWQQDRHLCCKQLCKSLKYGKSRQSRSLTCNKETHRRQVTGLAATPSWILYTQRNTWTKGNKASSPNQT